jgi:prevent-host-death family protein
MEVVMAENAAAQFNIHEVKTQLSRIIERVERGEEVVISRAGRPVAKVVPLPTRVRRTGAGSLKGRIVLSDDWDSPETNQEIAGYLGCTDERSDRSAATRHPGAALVAGR